MRLEYLFIGVVGPEASFRRIATQLSSITSPHFRKFILETNLREFPHLYSGVVQGHLADGLIQLDKPLGILATNVNTGGLGRFLFVLLAYNASNLIQHLTELNRQGDILVGEKVIGGNCSCVYIPALAPINLALEGGTRITCNVYEFLRKQADRSDVSATSSPHFIA